MVLSIVWLGDPNLDWGLLTCTEFQMICNALWADMIGGNFSKVNDSPLHSPNGRQICRPLGLCKETVKQSKVDPHLYSAQQAAALQQLV